MLTIYDLKNNVMLKQPDFFKLVEGYDSFKGVSFVGSFKIIEKELLPRFKQIDLILGMEDQKTGKNLDQLLNVSNKVKQLLSLSRDSDFLDRIENQTLNLRFTKDELFHSKYFIIENDTDFIIFNGSMNLTKKALKQNHEMLWMYEGEKNDLQDLKIYDEHQKLFKKNFEEDSVEYLDRKIINNLYGKTKKQITAIIADEVVDKVQKNIVEVNPDDIIKITKDADRKEETYELHHETVNVSGFEVGGAYFRTAQLLPIYQTMKHYNREVLLIHGLADKVVSPNASRKFPTLLPKSELHLIPDEGHMFKGKNRPEVLKLGSEFLIK